MTLVIGTDEAGYGPNLGPLVVAATAWRVPADGDAEARLGRAADAVAAAVGGTLWADSKRVHTPGAGLAGLERGVLAALARVAPRGGGGLPADGAALAARLGIADETPPPEWPRFAAAAVPADVGDAELSRVAAAIEAILPHEEVEIVAVACRVIHPEAFNAALDGGLNKSDILSRATLELAASLRATAPEEPALVWCDRHGGRKAYAALVGRHFGAALVQALEETAARSRYAVPADRLGVEFTVGGESRPPVALASMTAKYVRELAMRAFNGHWAARCPGLAPTAGYPLDARRWRHEAAEAIRAAGLPEASLWRRV